MSEEKYTEEQLIEIIVKHDMFEDCLENNINCVFLPDYRFWTYLTKEQFIQGYNIIYNEIVKCIKKDLINIQEILNRTDDEAKMLKTILFNESDDELDNNK